MTNEIYLYMYNKWLMKYILNCGMCKAVPNTEKFWLGKFWQIIQVKVINIGEGNFCKYIS